jgi:hypothetical protein
VRSTPIAIAAFAIATVCLVTNPVVAQAAKDLITGKDIKDGSITSADVRNRSLLLDDFRRGQLKPGPAGPQGEAGPPGTDGEEAFSRIVPIAETLPAIVSAARGVDAMLASVVRSGPSRSPSPISPDSRPTARLTPRPTCSTC